MDAPSINLNTLIAGQQNIVKAINGLNTAIGALNALITTLNTEVTAIATTLAAAFPLPLTGSTTYNPGTIANGAQAVTTVSVAGAVLGNYANSSFSLDLQGCTKTTYMSAADTVTVVIYNGTVAPVTISSGTLKVSVRTT